MTVYTEQASFWDGCHLKATVSTNGIQGGEDAADGWAEIDLADPDGTYQLIVELTDPSGSRAEATPGRVARITVRVCGDAEVLVLAEALEWSGRHLRELAGRKTVAYPTARD